MSDYQHRCLTALFRQAAPWLILHPASHHHRASTTTAAFPAIRCRCGRTFPCHPVFTVLQGGFTVRHVSTTAAFSAIRCRCGRTFSCHPRLHGAPRRLYGQAGFHNGSVSRYSVPLRSYVSLSPRPHGVPRRLNGQAGFHNGSVSRDSVPLWSYVSLSPRPHGVPRRLNGQAGFHNGSVFRDSVPLWHTVVRRARLRRSHFAMSSMSPKFISFIIKDIRFNNLPDPADFATKRPFSPVSSQVQHVSFFRVSDYQVFL